MLCTDTFPRRAAKCCLNRRYYIFTFRERFYCTCSIQVITDYDVWTVTFCADLFQRARKTIAIGENRFGEKGICLAIHTIANRCREIGFRAVLAAEIYIMGPFALVPFMECRHSVWSMRHTVTGNVWINGQGYSYGGYALYPGQSGIGGSAVGGIWKAS